jgi:pimeloyl-ACP methyl ester carboxylesterase
LEDEAKDLIAVLGAVGPPVLLVGHSYGAHVALLAASLVPERVRKLILYEPIWPHVFDRQGLQTLEGIAATGDWSAFTRVFFRDSLHVPLDELDQLRGTETWDQYVNDAKASLGDIRALASYVFDPERFAVINNPVLLQVGTESPRDLYVTDTLAAYLPKVRIEELKGQAHEAATTAPDLYAAAVIRFCQE